MPTSKRAIGGEIATIYRQDFRMKRKVRHGDDAGVRKVRSEIAELSEPELQVSRMQPDVEIRDQIAVQDHLQKWLGSSHQVSRLGESRSAGQQWYIECEIARPPVMVVLLDPVGDEKSGISDLRHDAWPIARALVPLSVRRDRAGIPSEEDTRRPSTRAGWSRAGLSEAGWRAGQARLVAPQAAGP